MILILLLFSYIYILYIFTLESQSFFPLIADEQSLYISCFILYIGMWSYLWQNFLIDSKIRSYIAEHIAKMYTELWCEALIEIGPGKWAITKLIEGISNHFFVIEKDVSLVQGLECRVQNWVQNKEIPKLWTIHAELWTHFNIIQGDVLETDVDELLQDKKLDSKKTLVVWNLPYYITSPILRKFFWNGFQNYAWGIFMLQDEVGQKLRSDAKKKSYLRWLINYAYQVNYLKWVPAKSFKPVPKVKSCLVECRVQSVEYRIERDKLIQFLEMFAPFSRKTLGAIRTMINKKSGCMFVIPETLKKKRLEELSFEELSQIVYSW